MACFRVARRRQLIVALILGVGLAGLFIVQYVLPVSVATRDLIGVSLLFVVIGALVFSFFNWRCPSCGTYLGRSISMQFCESCGARLR